MAAGLVAAAFAWATPDLPARAASAGECTWGQPGYRACVDELIAKRRAMDDSAKPAAGTATPQPRPSPFATAPANRRAPSLNPIDQTVQGVAPIRQPRIPPLPNDPQKTMDENLLRMQRDAARPPILPPNNDVIQVPGRICPSQGC